MFGRKTCTQLCRKRSSDALQSEMITPLRQCRLPLILDIRLAHMRCFAGAIASGTLRKGLIRKIYASSTSPSDEA